MCIHNRKTYSEETLKFQALFAFLILGLLLMEAF